MNKLYIDIDILKCLIYISKKKERGFVVIAIVNQEESLMTVHKYATANYWNVSLYNTVTMLIKLPKK